MSNVTGRQRPWGVHVRRVQAVAGALRARRATAVVAAATLAAVGYAGLGGGVAAAKSSSSWSKVVAQAKQEKTVLLYTEGDDIGTAMRKGFQKAYPWATVKYVVGAPGDLASRALTEARAGSTTADVLMLPGAQREALLSASVVVKSPVPNDSKMSKQFVDPTSYSHPVYVTPINLVYNTDKLKASQLPKDLYDLANPKWSGKIAFDQPSNDATAGDFLAAPRKEWGDAKWKKWLQGLKNNNIFLTADSTSAYQAVLRGEAEIGVDNPGDVLSQAKGAPVANGYYKDVIPFVQYVWQAKNASHPAMAKLFINWMLSKAGQTAMAETGRSPAQLKLKVKNSLSSLMPKGTQILSAADLQGFYNDPTGYNDIFNQYWPSA